MVVGRRIHEGRENSVVRVFYDRCCIEAGSGAWIDLENSIVRLVWGGRDARQWGVRNRGRVLAKSFSYMFVCPAE